MILQLSAYSVCAVVAVWLTTIQPLTSAVESFTSIAVDAIPLPLNPENPSATAIGNFAYAGGLELRARETNELHELSDVVMTAPDRILAVGDAGVLFDARLVLNEADQLIGIADTK